MRVTRQEVSCHMTRSTLNHIDVPNRVVKINGYTANQVKITSVFGMRILFARLTHYVNLISISTVLDREVFMAGTVINTFGKIPVATDVEENRCSAIDPSAYTSPPRSQAPVCPPAVLQ